MTAARLSALKTLEAFDFSFQPSLSQRLLWELADLSFLQTTTNVIMKDRRALKETRGQK